jgi:hypothetical protein
VLDLLTCVLDLGQTEGRGRALEEMTELGELVEVLGRPDARQSVPKHFIDAEYDTTPLGQHVVSM